MKVIEFENTIEIEQPIDIVFPFVSNFENVPKWNYYVLEVKKTAAEPIATGMIFHQTRKTDQQSFKIIEYEPGKTVSIQTLPGSQPSFEMHFSFEPIEEGTRVIDKWKLETGKPVFVEKLAKTRVKKAVKENLEILKKLLENGKAQLQDGRIIQL